MKIGSSIHDCLEQQPPPRSTRCQRPSGRGAQTPHQAELRPPIEFSASGGMCSQSTFAVISPAIVRPDQHPAVPAVRLQGFPPTTRCSITVPSITSKPELARRSRAFLLSTGVLQELIRLGGKKKPRNPPASAQQPRPPVPQLSSEAQEVRLLPRSPAPQSHQLVRSRA